MMPTDAKNSQQFQRPVMNCCNYAWTKPTLLDSNYWLMQWII